MSSIEEMQKLLEEKEAYIAELENSNKSLQILVDFADAVNKGFDVDAIIHRAVTFLHKSLHLSCAGVYFVKEEKLVLKTSPYMVPGLLQEVDYEEHMDAFSNIEYHDILGKPMLTIPIFAQDDLIGIIACSSDEIEEDQGTDNLDFWFYIGFAIGSLIEKGMLYNKALAASKTKSLFVANFSHEIRTPLTAIIGFSELLGWEKLTDRQMEHVESIRSSGNHLLTIVDNILDLSRIENNKLELSPTEFYIKDLCRDISSIFYKSAKIKNVDFIIDNQVDDNLQVYLDKGKLRQVVINLIGNSLKFTEKGSVILRIEPAEDTNKITFTVADTGIGIPPEKQQMIFGTFSQADETTTKKYGGTGLGLAISKRIVEMFGGQILVESEVGVGSNFFFTIPYIVAEENEDEIVNGGNKVLVVDDTEMNRKIIRYMLEPMGYEMDEASDGILAIDKVKENDFNLILMDLQMPKKDGYMTVKEIRSMGYKMPIVALSAYDGVPQKKKAFELGFNDYMVKPLKKDALIAKVVKYIGKAKADAEKKDDFSVLQQEFLDNVLKNIAELDEAFAEKNQEPLKMIGHKWKGTGKMFNYPDISAIGLEVENLNVEKDLAGWQELKKKAQAVCLENKKE